jgi:hypothetical protein
MELAQLVLEYLKVLVLPLAVILGLIIFRADLKRVFARLRLPKEGSAEIPGFGKYSWKQEVEQLRERSEQAALEAKQGDDITDPADRIESKDRINRLPINASGEDLASHERSNLLHMRGVVEYRDWMQLRDLAILNPVASVLYCWKSLHFLVYREAYTEKAQVDEDWDTQLPVIAGRLGATRRVVAVIADLRELRDRAEGGEQISRSDALDYVDAAEAALRGWLGSNADIESKH